MNAKHPFRMCARALVVAFLLVAAFTDRAESQPVNAPNYKSPEANGGTTALMASASGYLREIGRYVDELLSQFENLAGPVAAPLAELPEQIKAVTALESTVNLARDLDAGIESCRSLGKSIEEKLAAYSSPDVKAEMMQAIGVNRLNEERLSIYRQMLETESQAALEVSRQAGEWSDSYRVLLSVSGSDKAGIAARKMVIAARENWRMRMAEVYGAKSKDGTLDMLLPVLCPDGSRYTGLLVNGKKQGSGICIYASGNKYIGNFVDDRHSGTGKLEYADGGFYEGEWLHGLEHGKGTLLYTSGVKYEGDFANGLCHGTGTLIETNGFNYVGEFRNNAVHGKGKAKWPNGDSYEGDFANGLRHGTGTLIEVNGFNYVGEFRNNAVHGKGKAKWPNGDSYEGDFLNDLMHGKGKYTYLSGVVVNGVFKNGINVGP